MTKEQKQLRDAAVEYIGRCDSASLQLDDILGRIDKVKTVAQATMLLGALREELSDICMTLDPEPEAIWLRKEHK